MTGRCLLALVPVLASGCLPAYIYGHTGRGMVVAKPEGCAFEIFEGMPSRPFEELGVIAPEDIANPSLAGAAQTFMSAARPFVCKVGGDAVVVERNMAGEYVRGTVIRYRAP